MSKPILAAPKLEDVIKSPPGASKATPAEHLSRTFQVEQLPTLELEQGEGPVTPSKVEVKPVDKVAELEEEIFADPKPEAKSAEKEKEVEEVEKEKEKEEVEKKETTEEDELADILIPPGETKPKGKIAAKVEEGKVKPVEEGKPFDYTGYDETERKVLKNMSREARDYTAKLIKENKEQKNAHYLQDPRAYQLSPEYSENVQAANQIKAEGDYWMKQLTLCSAGKDWVKFLGYDKEGKAIFDDKPTPGNDEDAERLRMIVNERVNTAQQFRNKAQQVQQSYSQRLEQTRQQSQELRAVKFPWVKKPELMNHSLEIKGFGPRKISEIRNDILGQLPVFERGTIAAQWVADMFVGIVMRDNRLDKLNGTKQVAAMKTEEANLAEPTSRIRPAPDGGKPKIGKVKSFDSKGMPEGN